jgi:hypothetical protein
MIKVKPLKKNSNGQYMIASAMIFCLVVVAFGLTILFAPNINDVLKGIRTAMIDGTWSIGTGSKLVQSQFKTTIGGFLSYTTMGGLKFFTITPSIILISYVPIAVGGLLFLWMFILAIRLNVGFKSINRKNIKQVVNPIKTYSLTISSAWFIFIVLILMTFFTLISSSYLLFGQLFLVSPDHFLAFPTQLKNGTDDAAQTYFQVNGTPKIWWITYDLFANSYTGRTNGKFDWMSLIPLAPFLLVIVLQIIGLITGAVSWRWVNLYVLAAIGDAKALDLVNRRFSITKQLVYTGEAISSGTAKTIEIGEAAPEKLSKKDLKAAKRQEKLAAMQHNATIDGDVTTEVVTPVNEKPLDLNNNKKWDDDNLTHTVDDLDYGVNATLKSRCQSFFKNNMKMMEMSENTSNSLYRKFTMTYDALVSNRVDNKLNEIATGIEDYINFATDIDQKFVHLVSKVLGTNRGVFGAFSVELDELIAKYFNALKAWNLYEAELVIEQIFAIAAQNTELLAKVGYCLKYRLSNHYSFVNNRLNGIDQLNVARENKNYDAYRQICLQIIKTMSPNKLLLTGIVNQIY